MFGAGAGHKNGEEQRARRQRSGVVTQILFVFGERALAVEFVQHGAVGPTDVAHRTKALPTALRPRADLEGVAVEPHRSHGGMSADATDEHRGLAKGGAIARKSAGYRDLRAHGALQAGRQRRPVDAQAVREDDDMA